MNNSTVAEVFPTWRRATAVPAAVVWTQDANWDNEAFLSRVLELLEDELESRFQRPPEELTAFGASVLTDLVDTAPAIVIPKRDVQRNFLRLFLAVRLVEYCQMYGRTSLAFDWLVCAVSDRRWASVEQGRPLEVDYFPGRLRQFLRSTIPVIRGTAPWTVIYFIRSLYYYSWKSGGLRELAEVVLEDAHSLVREAIDCGDAGLVTPGVEATSALASWCLQGDLPNASEIVQSMVELYHRPDAPEEARKLVAITLATSVGGRTGHSTVEWAQSALAQHGDLLVQHEPVQMLVASCPTPGEMAEKYDDVMAAVEHYTRECDAFRSADRAEIAFRRIQLFDVFSPFVTGLVRIGRCSEAAVATAAWFGVPPERRRTSSVLGLLAALEEGVIYAVDGRAATFSHDSEAATRRLVEAVNHAFDLNIVVRDDHCFASRPTAGRRGARGTHADELAEATAEYYGLDHAADEIAGTQGLALLQPHTILSPLVPLVRSRLGVAWPIVTSFEEPATDRPIRKALIWCYGTILGGLEARAVAAILEAAGVACELVADTELTPEEFLQFYTDASFDLVWVTAHGMFDPREPHQAHIELSSDASRPMLLTELIRHRDHGAGRRLLFLNICLGASVVVTEAPPKLGLAAMLASAEQAVMSHVVEVSSFVAPLFGVGTAIPLARRETFIAAYAHALDTVRLDRHAAVELVIQASPQCVEFLEWLENGTYGVEPEDVRTWGTGAFYE